MNLIYSFLSFISQFFHAVKRVLRGSYNWILIFFAIWFYRIEFMSGTGQWIQIFSFLMMCYLTFNKRNGILYVIFKDSNNAVLSTSILYLYGMLSALWSVWPEYSFFLAFQNFMLIATLTMICRRLDTFENVEKTFLFISTGIILFLAVFARVSQPSLFIHHLTSGTVSAIVLTYCFSEFINADKNEHERKKILFNISLISAFTMVFSTSNGAYAAAASGIAVAFLLSKKRIYSLISISIAFALLVNEELYEKLMSYIFAFKTEDAINNLSGRETLWNVLIEYAWEKPWFGWGYGGAERAVTFAGELEAIDAHNTYIGIWGGLGFFGCLIALFAIIYLGTTYIKNISLKGYCGLTSATACALVNAYTFGFLSGKTCSSTIIFLFIVVLSDAYRRVQKNII